MIDPWVTIGAVILGGLLTAAVGEWQARNRFNRELELDKRRQRYWIDQQFWTRKADSYARICEILWEEMAYASDYENYMYTAPSSQKPPEAKENWKERREYLRQQGEIGGIFLSEAATTHLKTFYSEYSVAIDRIELDEIVTGVYSASKRCLDAMLIVAREDLRIVEPDRQHPIFQQTPKST